MAETVDIPVSAAQEIAEEFGYEQVIIIARKTGEGGREHCTTYGIDPAHCEVAARCGGYLKLEVMKWHRKDCGDDDVSEDKCAMCGRLEQGHGGLSLLSRNAVGQRIG